MVLTTTLPSMRVCHFLTRDRSLSDVKSMPWKFVKQLRPWTSSTRSLTLRNEWSSSFWRSAKETSTTRCLRASLAFFKPVVLLTRVFPTLREKLLDGALVLSLPYSSGCAHSRTAKVDGALIEYQSFLANGSTVRFLRPFLPLESLLFFPTAMLCVMDWCFRRLQPGSKCSEIVHRVETNFHRNNLCAYSDHV